MDKLTGSNDCPDFLSEGPLAEYRLPVIYPLPEGRYYNQGVVYDGTRLYKAIHQQRSTTGGGRIDPVLAEDLQLKFGMYAPSTLVESFPDYLETGDNLYLDLFSDDNEQLAHDLFAYFRERITRVLLKEPHGEERKNNAAEHLNAIKQTLTLMDGHGEVPASFASRQPGVFDILFSVHAGIENQIRFAATVDLAHSKAGKSRYNLQKNYPFLNIAGKRYHKSLFFCWATPTEGNRNYHCDIGTQLDLLEYLKQRGHWGSLDMNQNGHDLESGRYKMFTI